METFNPTDQVQEEIRFAVILSFSKKWFLSFLIVVQHECLSMSIGIRLSDRVVFEDFAR